MRFAGYISIFLSAVVCTTKSVGGEPVTLATVSAPSPNTAEEPLAAAFSQDQAIHFLDSASLAWQKQRKCFTCHTNFAYLYARGYVNGDSVAHQEVRQFAEELVKQRWAEKGPRWDAEVVASAAALAFNDRMTTGQLHPTTRTALDRMWTVQRADGGWDWLKCEWPPMEIDDHYGATLAAIAVGVAPENYGETEAAQQGMAALRNYLAKNPPQNRHHTAMLLWASTLHKGLMSPAQQQACVEQLLALQKEDGGWALATLGAWKRDDGTPQDVESSDGYGTGFVIFVLRQAGISAKDPALLQGIRWLKDNQRQSGRWFTRSLFQDGKHFISHAGTAFALMALGECGELQREGVN